MNSRTIMVLLVGVGFGASCDNNLWHGFKKSDSGFYYKYYKLGNSDYEPRPGDQVYAEVLILNSEGKVLFRNGQQQGTQLYIGVGNTKNGGISEAISMLAEGDSVGFKFNSLDAASAITKNKIPAWNPEYELIMKVNHIRSQRSKNGITVSDNDQELNELKQLKSFLIENGLNPSNHVQGIYLKTLKKGSGAKPERGKNVWIHYRGTFLNGVEFDNTRKAGQPLDFEIGKPEQVIRAFEIALNHMEVGGKLWVIAPSEYAFGAHGSATGIVPPYTSVVYELELIKVE